MQPVQLGEIEQQEHAWRRAWAWAGRGPKYGGSEPRP